MDMIYELDNYVTFFKEKSKDLTCQLTKTLNQNYLLLILTLAVKIIHPPLCRYICVFIFEERPTIKASY